MIHGIKNVVSNLFNIRTIIVLIYFKQYRKLVQKNNCSEDILGIVYAHTRCYLKQLRTLIWMWSHHINVWPTPLKIVSFI